MEINKTLILAAGKGTRMGEIGLKLPKVIWPIFEKTILELEIEYARSLGSENIFVNTHYYTEKLKEFFENKNLNKSATLIEEETQIDIGGAIHNLSKKTGYNGNLLVINSDQFLMLDKKIIAEASKDISNYDGVLFVTTVNVDDGYNEVKKDDSGNFITVIKNKELKTGTQIETYIGVSIINLSRLKPIEGESKFFDSVATSESKIKCINVDSCNYWDFGTLNQYYENMFKLLNCEEDEFKKFLINNKALITSKIKNNSYFSNIENSINLSKDLNPVLDTGTILIKGAGKKSEFSKAIVFNDIIQQCQ